MIKGDIILKIIKTIVTLLLVVVMSSEIFACRYTVREIGFADFGKDSYQFVLFKDNRISDTDAKLFKSISYAALLDANITVQVLDVQKEKSSQLLKYYKKSKNGELPNAILVSPEKRARFFSFNSKEDFTQTVWSLIEDIVTSTARDKLIEEIIRSYGVVFFIEGSNSAENMKAKRIVDKAIDEIKLIMMSLPKPVHIPPAIITIKANEIESEEILLWSLGWEAVDKRKPAVALIYGRGRKMGPMLSGENIKADIIKNMLRFIGEDCECGLDRSWMLGTMVPLRWDSKLKAAVLAQYGFDADNPMVISEMSQILSVAPERVNNSIDTDLLYGYSESVLTITDSAKKKNIEKPTIISDDSSFEIEDALVITLSGFLVIIIVGGVILVRAKRRNS